LGTATPELTIHSEYDTCRNRPTQKLFFFFENTNPEIVAKAVLWKCSSRGFGASDYVEEGSVQWTRDVFTNSADLVSRGSVRVPPLLNFSCCNV
jgi:hypothetical protein